VGAKLKKIEFWIEIVNWLMGEKQRDVCASEMLYILKRVRILLMRPDEYTDERENITRLVIAVCERADGTVVIREALEPSAPVTKKPFPPPPGI
jgi:hypothetical protein